MLHFIRERAQGWVAWFIVGLISIPFALWGVNSYLNGPSEIVVAKVNGKAISQTEYQQALQQYRDRMRSVLKDKFDPSVFDTLNVKQNVLNSLIDKKLLLSVSEDLGQRVSNENLASSIQSTPAFQKDGKFNADRYSLMLARAGLTPERYEAELRVETLITQITENVQKSTLAAQYSIDNLFRLEKQTREIAFGVVPALSLLDKVTVTDEQVKAYYDLHAANYLAPERMVVNYIELSVDALAKDITASDEELKSFYINNQDKFVGPEQRKASHILIEGDDEAAIAQLEKVKARLDAGESFATLASELSQDVGSAKEGGDLGYFQRGVMDSAFEDAVFGMKTVGQVSDMVKTEFGYHLIELTGIKKPESKSFEQAKPEVEALYRRQKAETLFYEKAEQLADLSYENPDSLDVAAEELGLEIKTSSEFQRQRNTSGIAKDPKVVAAAFSEDVLTNDLNSAVIELSKSDLLVLHKNKHTLSTQLPFESVAPAIKEQLRFENAALQAKEEGQKLLTELKSGVSPDSLFAENNWHAAKVYSRDEEDVSPQILHQAFSMAKPTSTDQAEFIGFTATNGNYVLLKLSAVTEGNSDNVSDAEREGLKSHLLRAYGESELQAFINSLKEGSDIEVFSNYL